MFARPQRYLRFLVRSATSLLESVVRLTGETSNCLLVVFTEWSAILEEIRTTNRELPTDLPPLSGFIF